MATATRAQPNGLARFFARRLLQAVPVLLGIVIFSFVILHLAPGDAVDVMAGEAGTGDAAYMAELRAKYGLDQPLPVQLLRYGTQILQLDLGYSIRNNSPVRDLILQRLGPTLLLMSVSIVASVAMGVLFGAIAAIRRNTLLDDLISLVALLAYAMPIFWIGLMLIILFSVTLGVLPSGGFMDVARQDVGPLARAVDIGRHLVLPALTLSLFYFAIYTRLMRASMLEVMGLDYIRTARAKGLGAAKVTIRHVVRNALLPIVTMLGMQMASLLGGAVVVETVFNWPGIGRLTYDAVFQRDYALLIGILLMSSALVIFINMLVDLAYSWLDPRIKAR
ncbi:ABC transporter permease protein [Azorhizobium caulinodans ORS 571]|uniref:ABC transporter permease protein n=1 Tax=Azorhizobium caulinodans (strain ATCC 43989 / DSM 5975 / JCM 20966 / LMG 6465 / NBRC 14845 / NCIMB 13405 / ORS 571) TaxID=438753 RepID=A8I8E2_AZOC5|nr:MULTISPECIES: ABC transporter permease [Azorhizobium]TDT99800.1 peptide/nickel transport system permease protein [Azorhizobium sp. AG788]BAF88649.1 ABC transporter permease protein [Azorhizobium caulinodans ORS 571]